MSRYDLTDTEWNAIQDLLPPEKSGKRGHPCKDNRTMESGMVWVLRSGSPWRDLPKEYGSWNGVYTRFNRWSKRGVWQKALAVLVQAWDPENIHIDGSYIRATNMRREQKGAEKPGSRAKPRRFHHQDPRRRRCPREPFEALPDRRRSAGHRSCL